MHRDVRRKPRWNRQVVCVVQNDLTGELNTIDDGGAVPAHWDAVCLFLGLDEILETHCGSTYNWPADVAKSPTFVGVRLFRGPKPIVYESLQDGLRRLNGDRKELCKKTGFLSWSLAGAVSTKAGQKFIEKVVGKGAGGPVALGFWVRDGLCLD